MHQVFLSLYIFTKISFCIYFLLIFLDLDHLRCELTECFFFLPPSIYILYTLFSFLYISDTFLPITTYRYHGHSS